MGKYIQGPVFGKADMLMDKYGAKSICVNDAQAAFDAGKGIVCVVDNGGFQAAAYCYSKDEIWAFNQPGDARMKEWLSMDRQSAEDLAS